MKNKHIDMINSYVTHPYHDIIKNYFGDVHIYEDELTYIYEIKSINFKYRRLYKLVNLNYKKHEIERMIDLNMKDIVKSLVYVMMDDYFDPKFKFVEFNDKDINDDNLHVNLKVSNKTSNRQREIMINDKVFQLSSKMKVEYQKIELFKIDMSNLSFEDIKKQLEDVSIVKDQLMTVLNEV